jgi:F-type H+-transporting ATPase subunit epsilon
MPLHFELVTPEKLVRSEDVYMVVVPGTVYSGPNTVTARIRVEGGFAEVNERGLTVLAEQAVEA